MKNNGVKVQIINKNNSEEMRGLFEVYKKTILGAYLSGKLVGCLIARKVWGGVGYCEALGVLNEYQRKGIGTKLLKEYEKISFDQGAHGLYLESDVINLEFYKKQGYSVLCLDKKGYFGTDNYVMKKVLQEPKEENFLR